MGGFVAQHVALRRPDLVRKLVVAGSGPGPVPELAPLNERVQAIMAKPDADADDMLYLFYPETDAARAAGVEHLTKATPPSSSTATPATPSCSSTSWPSRPRWPTSSPPDHADRDVGTRPERQTADAGSGTPCDRARRGGCPEPRNVARRSAARRPAGPRSCGCPDRGVHSRVGCRTRRGKAAASRPSGPGG
jgi:pimeloyl-ACP methyl ester carboxylesterase